MLVRWFWNTGGPIKWSPTTPRKTFKLNRVWNDEICDFVVQMYFLNKLCQLCESNMLFLVKSDSSVHSFIIKKLYSSIIIVSASGKILLAFGNLSAVMVVQGEIVWILLLFEKNCHFVNFLLLLPQTCINSHLNRRSLCRVHTIWWWRSDDVSPFRPSC